MRPKHLWLLRAVILVFCALILLTGRTQPETDWLALAQDVVLTGVVGEDVVAVAQTQLGYGEQDGFTLYGEHYGLPYGDWCAMFCAFCLETAQAKDIPLEINCARWVTLLSDHDLYRPKDTYTPKSGDLIFFDYNTDGLADHVGLVCQVTPEQVMTIEGNAGDMVQCITYDLADPGILGYGLVCQC